jgi:hypothetical protein
MMILLYTTVPGISTGSTGFSKAEKTALRAHLLMIVADAKTLQSFFINFLHANREMQQNFNKYAKYCISVLKKTRESVIILFINTLLQKRKKEIRCLISCLHPKC